MTSSGRRPRVRLRVLLIVLIVALPLSVYLWGRGSSAFAVQRIELSGARRVSAAKAAKTLRARFLGHNLFGVRVAQVAAALESFPYFAHVEIDRDFPNTLLVRIVEYRPAAVLFSAGRWYVVSREGRVLLRLPGVVAPPSAASGVSAGAQGSAGDGQADGDARSGTVKTTAASRATRRPPRRPRREGPRPAAAGRAPHRRPTPRPSTRRRPARAPPRQATRRRSRRRSAPPRLELRRTRRPCSPEI